MIPIVLAIFTFYRAAEITTNDFIFENERIMKNEVEKEPLKKVKKSDVAQKLEIPEEDLGMGSEKLIQCLEIKMETNDSSDNAGCALGKEIILYQF